METPLKAAASQRDQYQAGGPMIPAQYQKVSYKANSLLSDGISTLKAYLVFHCRPVIPKLWVETY